ncbi:MAG TPA: hypothetical protein VHP83_17220 [Aggregatilineaceae bacterium]|nr:hypothetical protein [Aggregatilineaceae bacterium]
MDGKMGITMNYSLKLEQAPIPDWVPEGGSRRVRQDMWRLCAELLYEIVTSGRSLTREITLNYLKKRLPYDPSQKQLKNNWKNMENKCNRAIDILFRLGLIAKISTPYFLSKFSYVMVYLTPKGQDYCLACGWPAVVSDWEILAKLHQAEDQKKHAMAILVFAMHARYRGWEVKLVPNATEGETFFSSTYSPDLVITQGEVRMYVEVETRKSQKKTVKWVRNMQAQRYVAVCAMTPRRRLTLEKEVQKLHIRCHSTDLKHLNLGLIQNILAPGDLWVSIFLP